jgi:hypothetical protein
VTRRRDVPTLAFTVPEAAEALRLSENALRVWVREGIVRTVRWQSLILVPRVELDRLIRAALDNGGTLPVPATPDSLRGPAAADGESGIGATESTRSHGVGEVTSERPEQASPASVAPTTNKARSGASDRATTTAG